MTRARRNADVRMRTAARHGDRRQLLIERLRAGDLHPAQIALAASLGDEDAKYIHEEIVDPDGYQIVGKQNWWEPPTGTVQYQGPIVALEDTVNLTVGHHRRARLLTAYAIDVAERLVPEGGDFDSEDVRTVHAALEAMRQWAFDTTGARRPTRKLLRVVEPILERWSPLDPDATAAIEGAFRVLDALSVSQWVLLPALWANAGSVDAERRWQKLRLAQYALGEVMPAPVRGNSDEELRRLEREMASKPSWRVSEAERVALRRAKVRRGDLICVACGRRLDLPHHAQDRREDARGLVCWRCFHGMAPNPAANPDERRRRLERQAQLGDKEAEQQLFDTRMRLGVPAGEGCWWEVGPGTYCQSPPVSYYKGGWYCTYHSSVLKEERIRRLKRRPGQNPDERMRRAERRAGAYGGAEDIAQAALERWRRGITHPRDYVDRRLVGQDVCLWHYVPISGQGGEYIVTTAGRGPKRKPRIDIYEHSQGPGWGLQLDLSQNPLAAPFTDRYLLTLKSRQYGTEHFALGPDCMPVSQESAFFERSRVLRGPGPVEEDLDQEITESFESDLLDVLDVQHALGWPVKIGAGTLQACYDDERVSQNPHGDEAIRRAQRGEGGDPKIEAWRRGIAVPPDRVWSNAPEWRAYWNLPSGGFVEVMLADILSRRLSDLPTGTVIHPGTLASRAHQLYGWVCNERGTHLVAPGTFVVWQEDPGLKGPDWLDPKIQSAVYAAYSKPRGNPPSPACPECGGASLLLGELGGAQCYRCRQCNWHWQLRHGAPAPRAVLPADVCGWCAPQPCQCPKPKAKKRKGMNPGRGDEALRRSQRGEGGDPKLEAWRRGFSVPPDTVHAIRQDWPATVVAYWLTPGATPIPENLTPASPVIWPQAVHVMSWLYSVSGGVKRAYRISHEPYARDVNTFDYGNPRWDDPQVQQSVRDVYLMALEAQHGY